mmetsp:Transcript_64099/g.164944  ORF Transcript_64099/g.164944 Transcript_64099/m.164944 type:complete len:279 (-) Transcript_64099:415-1251(-)
MTPRELLEVHHEATVTRDAAHALGVQPIDGLLELLDNLGSHLPRLAHREGQPWHNTVEHIVPKAARMVDVTRRRWVVVVQADDPEARGRCLLRRGRGAVGELLRACVEGWAAGVEVEPTTAGRRQHVSGVRLERLASRGAQPKGWASRGAQPQGPRRLELLHAHRLAPLRRRRCLHRCGVVDARVDRTLHLCHPLTELLEQDNAALVRVQPIKDGVRILAATHKSKLAQTSLELGEGQPAVMVRVHGFKDVPELVEVNGVPQQHRELDFVDVAVLLTC